MQSITKDQKNTQHVHKIERWNTTLKVVGIECLSVVYSGLNVIPCRKYTAFVDVAERVVLLLKHKIDVTEDITWQHDVNKNEDIKTVTFGEAYQFY